MVAYPAGQMDTGVDDPGGEKRPLGTTTQTALEVAEIAEEVVPAGHGVGADNPDEQ